MSTRAKVYAFLLVASLIGAGWYLAAKYYFNGDTAQANTNAPNQQAGKSAEDAVPVELAEVLEKPVSAYLTSTANLRALRDVVIAAQSQGVVRQILAEEGDFVEQGQVLCRLDDRDLEIRLKLTEQRLSQARLQLEKAGIRREKAQVQIENTQVELKRQEDAFAQKLVSEQEVARLRYQLDELEHDLRLAVSEVREFTHRVDELEAEIEQVKLELSRARITAPFSGHITERTVQLGQTVRNMDSLFRLGAFSPLYADVHLSEQEAHRIRPDQKARIMLGVEGSPSVQGQVVRLSPVVDKSTGTVKVTVELVPSNRGFKPGAFVRVDIETDHRSSALLVPKRAVIEEDGKHFIFVAQENSALRRPVVLGYESGREVEVREGIAAGEKVVVAGQGNLKDGGKIQVVK